MTYEEARERMEAAGAEHGRAAASWYFDGNTSREVYRWTLKGIQDGDPAVMDTLPSSPLSGEWADEPTPASVFRDVLDLDLHAEASFWGQDATTPLLDAYEEAFTTASQHAIEAAAIRALEPDDDPPEDRSSSASRQHYIDTGRYLLEGEAEHA